FAVTQRQRQRADRLIAIRQDREKPEKPQQLGYLARPFILCGLPFKRPKKGATLYRRENGDEVLEIVAHPDSQIPYGMDIEVLIWTCVLAKAAMIQNGGKCPRVLEFGTGADFLKAFDLRLDGASYRRAIKRFKRIFFSTWYFGKKNARGRTRLWSFRFFDGIDLWFSDDLDSLNLPGEDFKNNRLFLSEQLREELERALPVIEMETLRAWANNPTQIYFNIWLAWRCHDATPGAKIPLMGPSGLKEQCGFEGYDCPKRGHIDFRNKVKQLLTNTKISWPECPVQLITNDPARPDHLLIERKGSPIRQRNPKRLT
ncbi:MAG: hypothetical protein JO249_20025, partial [Acidobacteria bacterium]|nr:hypothetical protein [Acidobacteriota bacterium]